MVVSFGAGEVSVGVGGVELAVCVIEDTEDAAKMHHLASEGRTLKRERGNISTVAS